MKYLKAAGLILVGSACIIGSCSFEGSVMLLVGMVIGSMPISAGVHILIMEK